MGDQRRSVIDELKYKLFELERRGIAVPIPDTDDEKELRYLYEMAKMKHDRYMHKDKLRELRTFFSILMKAEGNIHQWIMEGKYDKYIFFLMSIQQ